MAIRSPHLDRLAELPGLHACSGRELRLVAQLVEIVEVSAGTTLPNDERDVRMALEPTRVLVVPRRALPALRELVPGLLGPPPVVPTWDHRLRWIPPCSPSSA